MKIEPGHLNARAFWRDVNAEIAEHARRARESAAEFLCECESFSCRERIDALLDDYERVRSDPALSLVALTHRRRSGDRVVRVEDGYAVVDVYDREAADAPLTRALLH